jgi:hypothetical protein
MRTLMEGERRVHTALLFASPLNINEWKRLSVPTCYTLGTMLLF